MHRQITETLMDERERCQMVYLGMPMDQRERSQMSPFGAGAGGRDWGWGKGGGAPAEVLRSLQQQRRLEGVVGVDEVAARDEVHEQHARAGLHLLLQVLAARSRGARGKSLPPLRLQGGRGAGSMMSSATAFCRWAFQDGPFLDRPPGGGSVCRRPVCIRTPGLNTLAVRQKGFSWVQSETSLTSALHVFVPH
jgi:hypothetical protein